MFAFGHGLSYTIFSNSPLKLESDTVDVDGELRLSITVTNMGKRRGTEVVQLYVADTATGVTLPAQQLVGFARLDLESGALRKVSFVIPLSLLGYTGIAGNFVIKPGRWRLAQVAARATFALVQSLPSLERCALSAKSAVPFSPSRKSARTCDPDTITYSHQ